MNNKKGVSPVVVTVLLIAIVVILIGIIFLWARSFIQEDIQKFQQPVNVICNEVSLAASIEGTSSLRITNNADRVPVYKIKLNIADSSGAKVVQDYANAISLSPGQSTLIDISSYGEVVSITPVLKGQKGDAEQEYTCPKAIDISSG
jgi:flagellin-like protein